MTAEQILKHLVGGGADQNAALKVLYRNQGKAFTRSFIHKGVSLADAEDLLQEAILKILKGASTFNGRGAQSPDPANAWMWQIVHNTLSDHFRRNRIKLEPLPDDDILCEIPIGQSDCNRDVEDCVTKGIACFALKSPERAYVIELVVDEIDQQEIADRINRSYAATRQYIKQCREHIRPFIKHCLDMLRA